MFSEYIPVKEVLVRGEGEGMRGKRRSVFHMLSQLFMRILYLE